MHAGQRDEPFLSVVIPVYREETRIVATLQALRAAMPPCDAEILLVDGSPGRETLAAACFVPGLVQLASPPGRSLQMNAGAAHSRGGILLFLHADTRLPQSCLRLIRAALDDPTVAGGAFALRIESTSPLVRAIGLLSSLRARITRVPFGDQAIFIRRACFMELGGFAPIPVMEDVELMRRLKKNRRRIVLLKPPVRTSGRRFEREGALFCSGRNILLRALYSLGVDPVRLASYYPLHSQQDEKVQFPAGARR